MTCLYIFPLYFKHLMDMFLNYKVTPMIDQIVKHIQCGLEHEILIPKQAMLNNGIFELVSSNTSSKF